MPAASEPDFQSVVRGQDFERRAAACDFLETPGLTPDFEYFLIAEYRLVVEQAQAFGTCHLAQFDAGDIARMAPVFLHRRGVGQRIHGVEDHQIGAAEKSYEGFG